MGKKLGIVAIIVSIIAIGLSCFGIYKANQASKASEGDIQYVMYLGTNDKDTNNPVFTQEDAKKRADDVLTKYFDGFTIEEAQGGWRNDDGSVAHEYTLVIILSDTDLDKVHKAADELVKEFNQSSVLITQYTTKSEYYPSNGSN